MSDNPRRTPKRKPLRAGEDARSRTLLDELVALLVAPDLGRHCGYDHGATACPMSLPCWHHRRNSAVRRPGPGGCLHDEATGLELPDGHTKLTCLKCGDVFYERRLDHSDTTAAKPPKPSALPERHPGRGR